MSDDVAAIPGMTPELAYWLLWLEDQNGIPADSMAAVMSGESGLNPHKPNVVNGKIVADGLIQLTKGANLPGFTTDEEIASIQDMSIADQFQRIVKPYYDRIPSARGASPGKLHMLNFLAAHADDPLDTLLGTAGDPDTGWIYRGNWGFDPGARNQDGDGGKGYITVGDVYASTEAQLARAHGARMAPETPGDAPTQGSLGAFPWIPVVGGGVVAALAAAGVWLSRRRGRRGGNQ